MAAIVDVNAEVTATADVIGNADVTTTSDVIGGAPVANTVPPPEDIATAGLRKSKTVPHVVLDAEKKHQKATHGLGLSMY